MFSRILPLALVASVALLSCSPSLHLRPLDSDLPAEAERPCRTDEAPGACFAVAQSTDDATSLGQVLTDGIVSGHLPHEFLSLALSLNPRPAVLDVMDPAFASWHDLRLTSEPAPGTEWIHIGESPPQTGETVVHTIHGPEIPTTHMHADLLQHVASALGARVISWTTAGVTWVAGAHPATRILAGGSLPMTLEDAGEWLKQADSLEEALLHGSWADARKHLAHWEERLSPVPCWPRALLAATQSELAIRSGDSSPETDRRRAEDCEDWPLNDPLGRRAQTYEAMERSEALLETLQSWRTGGMCSPMDANAHAEHAVRLTAIGRPDRASRHMGIVAGLKMDSPSVDEWLKSLEMPLHRAMRPQALIDAIHWSSLVRHKAPHILCDAASELLQAAQSQPRKAIALHAARKACGPGATPGSTAEALATSRIWTASGREAFAALGDGESLGWTPDALEYLERGELDDDAPLHQAILLLASSAPLQALSLLEEPAKEAKRPFPVGEVSMDAHGRALAVLLTRLAASPTEEHLVDFRSALETRLPEMREIQGQEGLVKPLGPLSRSLIAGLQSLRGAASMNSLLEATDAASAVTIPANLSPAWTTALHAAHGYAWSLVARQAWGLQDFPAVDKALRAGARAMDSAVGALLSGPSSQLSQRNALIATTLWTLGEAGATPADAALQALSLLAGHDCAAHTLKTLIGAPDESRESRKPRKEAPGLPECKASLQEIAGHMLGGATPTALSSLLTSHVGLADATRARRPRTHVLRAFRKGTAVPDEGALVACEGGDYLALLGPSAAALATPLRRPAYTAAALARYTALQSEMRGTPVLECAIEIPMGEHALDVIWTGLPRIEGLALPDRSRVTLRLKTHGRDGESIRCGFRTDPRITLADRVNDRFLLATHALLGRDHVLAHRALVENHQDLHAILTRQDTASIRGVDLNLMAWTALLARLHGHVFLGQDLDLIYLELARTRGLTAATLAQNLSVPAPLLEVRHIGSLLPIVEAWTTPDKTAQTSTLIAAANAISARSRLFPKTGAPLAGSVLRASLGDADTSPKNARRLRRGSKRHPSHQTTLAWRMLIESSLGKFPPIRKVTRILNDLESRGLHGELALFASRISALATASGDLDLGQKVAHTALGMLHGDHHALLRARLLEGVLEGALAKDDPQIIEDSVRALLLDHAGHVPADRLLNARIDLVNAVADQRDLAALTTEVHDLEQHMRMEAPHEAPFLFALRTLGVALDGLHSGPDSATLESLHKDPVASHPAVAIHADLVANLRTLPPRSAHQKAAIKGYLQQVFGWSP